MALNRSDKSRILRRYFPGMTRNSEMSTEPSLWELVSKVQACNDIRIMGELEDGLTSLINNVP